jgi:hypothetical protein
MLSSPAELDRLGRCGLAVATFHRWERRVQEFVNCVELMEVERALRPRFAMAEPLTRAVPGPRARRVVLTMDVEEQFDWEAPGTSTKCIPSIGPIVTFQERARELGVRPLYFLSYLMLQDVAVAQQFREWEERGWCDLGIHLHAWTTPPLLEEVDEYASYQCNLPDYLEYEKFRSLVAVFCERIGHPPLYHRAGKYGIGRATLSILNEWGVRTDCSPSASFDFTDRHGPDFGDLPSTPLLIGDTAPLLCLPVSGTRFLRGPDIFPAVGRAPFLRRLTSPARLSPEDNSLRRLKRMVNRLASGETDDLVIALHSTSLVPGATIYADDAAAAAANRERTFDLIRWMRSAKGIEPVGIREVCRAYGLPPRSAPRTAAADAACDTSP